MDAGKNPNLAELYCFGNNLTYETLKLPVLSSERFLYFNEAENKNEGNMLTPVEVDKIKKETKWIVKQKKGGEWVDYIGEGYITMTTGKGAGEYIWLSFGKGEEPKVEGAEYTGEQQETLSWIKKKYKLQQQNLSIKGKITALCCEKCGLSSLDVRYNKKLRVLLCNDNQLTELDVSQNPALRDLECYLNQLSEEGSLKLASCSEIFRGDLRYKKDTQEEKNRELPKAEVQYIKNKLYWDVKYYNSKNAVWYIYNGI